MIDFFSVITVSSMFAAILFVGFVDVQDVILGQER